MHLRSSISGAFALSLLLAAACGPGATSSHQGTDSAEGVDASEVLSARPVRYRDGALHSPYTRAVVTRLREVMAAAPEARPDVFAKVGDSITVDRNFLHCFVTEHVRLDAFASLESTRAYFATAQLPGGTTSFDRNSLAAGIGWRANRPLQGTPSPLDQELDAVSPAFAVVMYGTNDTNYYAVADFERNLGALVDRLLERGVVPLVSTIPPRGARDVDATVTEMNAVVRLVAQTRQVPLMDYNQTMKDLPNQGLSPDGVHPVPYSNGFYRGCFFTPEALARGGVNQRNLLVLAALDRARQFLLEDARPEYATGNTLAGRGSWSRPYTVDDRVFIDARSTASASNQKAAYGCAGSPALDGPEVVYRVELTARTWLRARVFSDESSGLGLRLLSEDGQRCVAAHDRMLDLTVGPGTFLLAVDGQQAGDYRLTVTQGR